VPTLSETYLGFVQISWFGLLAPMGLPKEVSIKIHKDVTRTLRFPEVQQRLTEQGFDIVASSPEEFLAFVQGESDKLGRLIRDNKIMAE
jgi:tripartite-type tricarboxylate transporter receptor subunit TctC